MVNKVQLHDKLSYYFKSLPHRDFNFGHFAKLIDYQLASWISSMKTSFELIITLTGLHKNKLLHIANYFTVYLSICVSACQHVCI